MIARFFAKFFACLAGAVFLNAAAPVVAPAQAQVVPRVKAKVLSFDGHRMKVQPLAKPPASIPDSAFTVSVLPQTRYVVTVPALLSDFKPGDYAGAAVTGSSTLTASELFLYPPDLAGTGEGRFNDNGRVMINGKVAAASPGTIALLYHGTMQTGPICDGRAAPPALAGALACTGTATITVPGTATVMALSLGNVGLIAPGAVVTLSLARNPQGDFVTPGVTIEGAALVANPPPSP